MSISLFTPAMASTSKVALGERSPLLDVTNASVSSSTPRRDALDSSTGSSRQRSFFDLFSTRSDDPQTSSPAREPSPCVPLTDARVRSLASELDDDDDATAAGKGKGKRRRSSERGQTAELVGHFDCTRRKVPSLHVASGQQLSAYAVLNRRQFGLRVSPSQLSMRPWLQELVSHNELDVYRCPSALPYRSFAPPFACAFSSAAKAGGKQLLALASEEGTISFVNASEDNQFDAEHGRTSFQAHNNSVFDIAWTKDDRLIATASGDQTSKLFDSETQTCVGVLDGHTCTIKNVAWDPFNENMLATASRDGSIRIWDRRTPSGTITSDGQPHVATVNHIKNAHGSKGKATKSRSATKSVTTAVYLQQAEHLLASSGSSDSIVKIWDLRKAHSRRANPEFVENNEEAVAERGSSRPHGIASMALSPNGQKLYALSTDSTVSAFDPLNLSYPAPLTTFKHPQAIFGSFYVRLAVSPCSRYLASGSSDGGVYTWDTAGNGSDGVRLVGHEKEVGCVSWGNDTIASCSDDNLVRIWKFNSIAREARTTKTTRWRYAGDTEHDSHT